MLFGCGAFGTTPWGTSEGAVLSTLSPLYEIWQRGFLLDDFVLLFELEGYDPVGATTTAVRAYWTNASDKTWRGTSADPPPGSFPPILLQPANIQSSLLGGDPFTTDASGSLRFGNIELAVDDSRGWEYLHHFYSGRPWTLKAGRIATGYSEFQVVSQGTIKNFSFDETTVKFQISDPDEALKKDLQQNFYTGEGDLGGSEDLKDRKKPLCWGTVFNIQPVRIDPVLNIYQVHDGPVNSIVPYDGAYPLSATGAAYDFATYAELRDWDGTGGTWASCLVEGCLRVAATEPFFATFTCDVEGDADPAYGGFTDNVVDLIERILGQRSTVTNIDGIARLRSFNLGSTGVYYADGGSTIDSCLNDLTIPILVYHIYTPTGTLFFGRVQRDSVRHKFYSHEIISLKRARSSKHISKMIFGYRKNYTLQKDDVVDGADPARLDLIDYEYRQVEIDNTSTPHLRAETYELNSLLQTEAQAQAEAQRQVDLSEYNTSIYIMETDRRVLGILPGQVIRIVQDKLGLQNGPTFTVLETTTNMRNQKIQLVLWGHDVY